MGIAGLDGDAHTLQIIGNAGDRRAGGQESGRPERYRASYKRMVYHTVAFTREANAPLKRIGELEAKCLNPISPGDRASEIKPTHRQYLLDARFGVLLRGKGQVLKSVAATLQNPCWGVWLGRKNCIPAKPLFVGGPFEHAVEAWQALRQKAALPADFLQEQFTQVVEAADGTDSFDDHPVSFGNGKSSGPESRQFVPRRVKIISRSQ